MRTGSRWKSSTCGTEVIVIRAKADDDLWCGGAPMRLDAGGPRHQLDPSLADGTQIGKRYVDEQTGVEVLCTKAGLGTLTIGGRVMPMKDAKPLPSSD